MNKPLPEDPMMRDLVKMARRHQMTRRAALAGAGAAATTLALAACSPGGSTATALTPATDVSDTEKTLVWHNWPAYMDESEDGKTYPTLARFEEQSGIKVEYKVEIDDNNSYYGKVKDQLALGQDIGADVACPTEWLVARLVNLGYVQTFDEANIPNKANLAPAYLGNSFDPKREKSLPWQGILAGIGYNKKAYKAATGKDAPTTMADLWAPELKGRVGVLSEMRDTIGLILLEQGIDITSESSLTLDAFMNALDFFEGKVNDGQIAKIKGNSYLEDLKNGDTIAAVAWSGDITVINAETDGDNFGFVFPESGATISADSFVIPMGATHKKNAEALMNYYYDPVNAAELAAWVNYVTPVVGAKEEAIKLDPALAENQLIFPSAETLAKTHAFRALSGSEEQKLTSAFQKILLGA